MKIKTAIFGGSFNPIHNAHLSIIHYLSVSQKIQNIILIPTFIPPHKQNIKLLKYEHRIELIKLAIQGKNNITVSNIEQDLPQPSYTYQTLQYLKENYSNHDFYLVLGEDSYLSLLTWKNYDYIMLNTKFIVFKRYSNTIIPFKNTDSIIIENNFWLESSTKLREDIKEYLTTNNDEIYKKVQKELPPPVLNYIINNKLYL